MKLKLQCDIIGYGDQITVSSIYCFEQVNTLSKLQTNCLKWLSLQHKPIQFCLKKSQFVQ